MGPRGRGTAVASAPTTPSGTSTASHTATAKPLTVEPAGATLTGATQPVMTSSHQQGALANTGHTKVAPPPPSTAISADTTTATAIMGTTLDNCWLGSDPMLPQTINLQLTLS